MAKLVGLNEAKAQLRVDSSDDDGHIELLIHAASGAVLNYLKRDLADIDSDNALNEDSDGVIEMEDEVKLATLYLVGVMYRDRDGSTAKDWEHGYLPRPVMNLLYALRDPSLS